MGIEHLVLVRRDEADEGVTDLARVGVCGELTSMNPVFLANRVVRWRRCAAGGGW